MVETAHSEVSDPRSADSILEQLQIITARLEGLESSKEEATKTTSFIEAFGVVAGLAGIVALMLGTAGAVWGIYVFFSERNAYLEDLMFKNRVLEIVKEDKTQDAIEFLQLLDDFKSVGADKLLPKE